MNDYDEFYYSNVCHVCKTKSKALKSCASCKLFRYCSVDHQKLHWPRHRALCNIVKEYRNRLDSESCFSSTKDNCLRSQITLKIELEKGLKRPLNVAENQIWMFPRMCAVCHDTRGTTLFDCPECPSVSYCSEAHQRIHKSVHIKICNEMRKQYIYYCNLLKDEPTPLVQIDMNIPFSSIVRYYDIINEKSLNCDTVLLRTTERLSHLMTLLYAMTISNLIVQDKIVKNKITIHIVGAIYEYNNFNRQLCELIFHWLPNLKELTLAFVGPEVQMNYDDEWKFCDKCNSRDISLHYQFKTVLYSKYYLSNTYNIPDIIGVYNCGFNEFTGAADDPWKASLPLLLFTNAPILITSYTAHEASQDLKSLKSCCDSESCQILACQEKNEFRSPIALRDWMNADDIYYNNNYLSVMKKS